MDYSLNEGQEMLKKTARDFLIAECPKGHVREMAMDNKGYSSELWHKMAQLGWMGLAFPEKYNGSGASFLDLAVLMEEMGRALLPGPFFSTVMLGGMTILEAGSEAQKQDLLPKIAEGKLIVTLALHEPNRGYGIESIALEATPDGDNYVIDGTKMFVPDAHIADYVICACKTGRGITLFLVKGKAPGVKCLVLKTIAGDKQCEVIFQKAKVSKKDILGRAGEGKAALQEVLRKAAVAKCVEMLGGAQQALEMTVDYVKQRIQFGQPVGAFQAVQHHCSNMATAVDSSRVMAYKVAWMLGEGLPCVKEAAMAKSWVSEACKRAVLLGHQCIGGVAFMEDHDLPLYTRRLKSAEVAFGDADFHYEIVAQQLGL